MSDLMHDDDDPADYDLEAAEYVLGTLSPDRARGLEARAAQQPEIAAAIVAWQERLHVLVYTLPHVSAPASVWPRLERAIRPRQVLPLPLPVRVKLRVRVWQGIVSNFAPGFVGAMIGALVVAALVTPKMLISKPAVAALQSADAAQPAFLIMVTKDGWATVIANNVLPMPGRSFQLWGLTEGSSTPVSLGLLPTSGRVRVPAIVPAGTLLLVTSETLGGAPQGQPTTKPLYSGRMIRG